MQARRETMQFLLIIVLRVFLSVMALSPHEHRPKGLGFRGFRVKVAVPFYGV